MKKLAILALMLCFTGLQAQSAHAVVEPNYTPGKPPAVTLWYGSINELNKQADLNFIAGMRPHHAGALTMSKQYLSHKQAANTQLMQLAKGIIHNQSFEIGMLDTVKNHLDKLNPGKDQRIKGVIATKGLAQKQKFVRMPMPGFMSTWGGSEEVTKEDVRFAKAMIVHHEAALDMAHAYLADTSANNGYLRLLCLDILVDQTQEINFMKSIIAQYKGDPDKVKIDPSMVHGMEGMRHGKSAHDDHQGH